MLFTNLTELVVLLVVCSIAAVCFVAAVVLLVMTVRSQKRVQGPVRTLTGIAVDAAAAKREFAIGEEFTCEGLIVTAEYNIAPTSEPLTAEAVTADDLARITEAGAATGCYVIKPDLTKAGDDIVIVKYRDKATYYSITVAEPAEEPAPVEEPAEPAPVEPKTEEITQEEPEKEEVLPAEEPEREEVAPEEELAAPIVPAKDEAVEEEQAEGVLRYERTFLARYIQSGDDVKNRYTALKNELLSYKKVKARTSRLRETFHMGRTVVARLAFRGNTMCIYLPLNAADYEGSKYKVEDVSDNATYADTPCMYRLKNERRVRYAMELYAAAMERLGGERIGRVAEDYYLPYEGIVELINKGLARRVVKKKISDASFARDDKLDEAAAVTDEPAEE